LKKPTAAQAESAILNPYRPIANTDRCAFPIAAWDGFIDLWIDSSSHSRTGTNANPMQSFASGWGDIDAPRPAA
jgi:hypothetical protein